MYRIVITKEENVTATEVEWRKLWDNGAIPEGSQQYGNVETTVEKVKQTQLLDQRVDTIDLKRVISAVNDMPEFVPPQGSQPGRTFMMDELKKEQDDGPANLKTQA